MRLDDIGYKGCEQTTTQELPEGSLPNLCCCLVIFVNGKDTIFSVERKMDHGGAHPFRYLMCFS